MDEMKESEAVQNVDIKNHIESKNGTKKRSRYVLTEAFRFIQNSMIRLINQQAGLGNHNNNNTNNKNKKNKNSNNKFSRDDIQWFVTVPAIWSDYSKNLMLRCATNGGMVNEQILNHLKIVYEPECAAMSVSFEIQQANEQIVKEAQELKELQTQAQNIANILSPRTQTLKLQEKQSEKYKDQINHMKDELVIDQEMDENEIKSQQIQHQINSLKQELAPEDRITHVNTTTLTSKLGEVVTSPGGWMNEDTYASDTSSDSWMSGGDELEGDMEEELYLMDDLEGNKDKHNCDKNSKGGHSQNELNGAVESPIESPPDSPTESPTPSFVKQRNHSTTLDDKLVYSLQQLELKRNDSVDSDINLEEMDELELGEHIQMKRRQSVLERQLELQLRVGECYILADLGGGTADFACHRIKSKHKIEDIFHPTGGPWGSDYINKEFIKLIKKRFRDDGIKQNKQELSNFMAKYSELNKNSKEVTECRALLTNRLNRRKNWIDDFRKTHSVYYYQLENNFNTAKCNLYNGMSDKDIDDLMFITSDYNLYCVFNDREYHNVDIPLEFKEYIDKKLKREHKEIKGFYKLMEKEKEKDKDDTKQSNDLKEMKEEASDGEGEGGDDDSDSESDSDDSDYDYEGQTFKSVMDGYTVGGSDESQEEEFEWMIFEDLDDKLRIHLKVWHEKILDKLINNIVNHCQWLLDNIKIVKKLKYYHTNNSNKGNKMYAFEYIVFVGGFSSCKYLQRRFVQRFGSKSKYKIGIIFPQKPTLSVLDGALRYAYHFGDSALNRQNNFNAIKNKTKKKNAKFGNYVSSRRMAQTYGICIRETVKEFEKRHDIKLNIDQLIKFKELNKNNSDNKSEPNIFDSKHRSNVSLSLNLSSDDMMGSFDEKENEYNSVNKLSQDVLQEKVGYDSNSGEYYMYGVFHPFVRKGDKVKRNARFTQHVKPVDVTKHQIYIDLFASEERNPIFVSGVPIASKSFNLPQSWISKYEKDTNNKGIPIEFSFGDTQIGVRVGDSLGDQQMEITLDYH